MDASRYGNTPRVVIAMLLYALVHTMGGLVIRGSTSDVEFIAAAFRAFSLSRRHLLNIRLPVRNIGILTYPP